MSRNTNPLGRNGRGRSWTRSNDGEKSNGERKYIVYYKCNNLGHIARNCRAPNSQNGANQKRNAPICQLCHNFEHTTRFYRMDRRNLNRNKNYRRNNNKNDRRNDSNNNDS